jgi:flagellar M-ring protein FliF
MGFLNQSMAQLRDLWASMTPAARVTAALLLGVIGVSLGYLFQDYTGGSKEYLLNGAALTADEANRMQAAIAEAGLNDYVREGNQILVPRGQKATYLGAAASAGALPRNLDTMLLDETMNFGITMDGKTRDARLKAARELMLSMILRKMDGVEDANVLFDIREAKGFEERLTTAMVSVRPAAGEALSARTRRLIREAVSKAIAGLDPKDITVLDLLANTQYGGESDINADDYDSPYYQTKITYEKDMKARIENLLRDIPGLRVQVTAELDEKIESQSRAVTSTGETQTIREETDKTAVTDTQLEDRGPVGATAQGPQPPQQPAAEAVAKNEHKTETDVRDATNFVPTNEEVQKVAGLAPEDVRATIAYPSDYLVSIWRERKPDEAPDELPTGTDLENITKEQEIRITDAVAPLLPKKPGEEAYPRIKVTVYQSLTPPPVVEPTMANKALMWANGNSGSLIMAGLAMVSLVMLRGMVKSIPSPQTNVVLSMPGAGAAEGGAGGLGEDGYGGGEGAIAGSIGGGGIGSTEPGGGGTGGGRASGDKPRQRLRLKKGPSLKDDLTDMVREDPDAAAAILRTWITSAG